MLNEILKMDDHHKMKRKYSNINYCSNVMLNSKGKIPSFRLLTK